MTAETRVVTIGFNSTPEIRTMFVRGPIRAKVESQLRELLKPFGIPLHRYRFSLIRCERATYQDHHGRWQGWYPVLERQAEFTHKRTKAKISVTEIWLDGDGTILQVGTQYGELTY